MTVADPGKFALLLIAIIGAVVLLGLGAISEPAGVGIISAALGYVTGNGRLAARGGQPAPMIGRTKREKKDEEGGDGGQ